MQLGSHHIDWNKQLLVNYLQLKIIGYLTSIDNTKYSQSNNFEVFYNNHCPSVIIDDYQFLCVSVMAVHRKL